MQHESVANAPVIPAGDGRNNDMKMEVVDGIEGRLVEAEAG